MNNFANIANNNNNNMSTANNNNSNSNSIENPRVQQYCLRWNNHRSNLLTVFDELLQNESFTDVTLACETGKLVKCHKMVLAACSIYFQKLFTDLPCSHPVIVLKDVGHVEIRAILEYMYRGEVNVAQDQLGALLKVAETLKIKGLMQEKQPGSPSDENPYSNSSNSSGGSGGSTGSGNIMDGNRTTGRSGSGRNDGGSGGSNGNRSVPPANLHNNRTNSMLDDEDGEDGSPNAIISTTSATAASLSHSHNNRLTNSSSSAYQQQSLINSNSSRSSDSPTLPFSSNATSGQSPAQAAALALSLYGNRTNINGTTSGSLLTKHSSSAAATVYSHYTNNSSGAGAGGGNNNNSTTNNHFNHMNHLNHHQHHDGPPAKRKKLSAAAAAAAANNASAAAVAAAAAAAAAASGLIINRDTPILRTVLGQGSGSSGSGGSVSGTASAGSGQSLSPEQTDSSQPVSLVCHSNSRSLANNDDDFKVNIKSEIFHNDISEDSKSFFSEMLSGGLSGSNSVNNTANGSNLMDSSYEDELNKRMFMGASPHNYGQANTSGGNNNSIASYVPGSSAQKPEWKRYKQYTRQDINSAIEAVKNGMSALQAARRFGVPSRTLYDKVRKQGIVTTRPFRRSNNSNGPGTHGNSPTSGNGPGFPYGVSGLKGENDDLSMETKHIMNLEATILQHAFRRNLCNNDINDNNNSGSLGNSLNIKREEMGTSGPPTSANNYLNLSQTTSPRYNRSTPSPPMAAAASLINFMRQINLAPMGNGGNTSLQTSPNSSQSAAAVLNHSVTAADEYRHLLMQQQQQQQNRKQRKNQLAKGARAMAAALAAEAAQTAAILARAEHDEAVADDEDDDENIEQQQNLVNHLDGDEIDDDNDDDDDDDEDEDDRHQRPMPIPIVVMDQVEDLSMTKKSITTTPSSPTSSMSAGSSSLSPPSLPLNSSSSPHSSPSRPQPQTFLSTSKLVHSPPPPPPTPLLPPPSLPLLPAVPQTTSLLSAQPPPTTSEQTERAVTPITSQQLSSAVTSTSSSPLIINKEQQSTIAATGVIISPQQQQQVENCLENQISSPAPLPQLESSTIEPVAVTE